jgi:hypothetical protein
MNINITIVNEFIYSLFETNETKWWIYVFILSLTHLHHKKTDIRKKTEWFFCIVHAIRSLLLWKLHVRTFGKITVKVLRYLSIANQFSFKSIYKYIHVELSTNSCRFLADNCLTVPLAGIEFTILGHYSTNLLSMMTNHLASMAKSTILQCTNSIYRVVTSARSCNKVGHLFWFTILAQHETNDVILYIHSVHKHRGNSFKLQNYKMRLKQIRLNWINSMQVKRFLLLMSFFPDHYAC